MLFANICKGSIVKVSYSLPSLLFHSKGKGSSFVLCLFIPIKWRIEGEDPNAVMLNICSKKKVFFYPYSAVNLILF